MKLRKDSPKGNKIYFEENSPLIDMPMKTLQNLLRDYYDKELTVTKVIKKYHLMMRARDVSEALPFKESDAFCPYDKTRMLEQYPSKSTANYVEHDKVCPKCWHQEFTGSFNKNLCGCDNCQKRRHNFQLQMADMYESIKYQRPNYNDLKLSDKVALAALIQDSRVNDYNDFQATVDKQNSLSVETLSNLSERHLIAPSAHNIPEDFQEIDIEKGEFKFDARFIRWRLNVQIPGLSDEKILKAVRYLPDNITFTDDEVNELYHQIVMDIMINLVGNRIGFFATTEDETISMNSIVIDWLAVYSPRRIQLAVHKLTDDNRQMMKLATNYTNLESVMTFINDWLEKNRNKTKIRLREDDLYYFDQELDSPEAEVFFDQVLGDDFWRDKMIPEEAERLGQTPPFILDNMLDDVQSNLKMVSPLIKNAQSFSITKVGVCINYKNASSKLITDELTAYKYFKDHGKISSDEDDWKIEDLGYQVDSFYSLNFILELIKKLHQKKIPEVLQKI